MAKAKTAIGPTKQKAQPKQTSITHASQKKKSSALSETYVVDSESEDDADAAVKPTTATKASAPQICSSDESESASEQSDGEESDSSTGSGPPQNGAAKGLRANGTGQSAKASGLDDESDEDDDEEDEDEEDAMDIDSRPENNAQQSRVTAARITRTFRPPQGFEAVPPSASSSSSTQLQSSIQNGQQIWHISAPKAVPLSTIKEIAWKSIVDGDKVLSHDGANYGFASTRATADNPETRLLLPSSEGYTTAPISFSRTLRLQQVFEIPELANDKGNAADGSAAQVGMEHGTTAGVYRDADPDANLVDRPNAAVRPAATSAKKKREQPKLKENGFLPMGVTTLIDKYEDEADGRAVPQTSQPDFRTPPTLPVSDVASPSKKRKKDETKEERAARKAAKKAKREATAAPAVEATKATVAVSSEANQSLPLKQSEKGEKKHKKRRDKHGANGEVG